MLAQIIVCPLCHAALDEAQCTGCGRLYPVVDGVLDLTPSPPPDPRARDRWELWEQLQANAQQAYEIDPPSSLSVGHRSDAQAFAEFASLEGLVLDVGCGVQALPSYGRGLDGRLIGIDPLRGARDREFTFVQGLAEYLPFRDRTFDRVLFATSIDHLLVPELALAEAHRVTKSGGWVCLWLGELPPQRQWDRIRRRILRPREARIRTPRAEMTFTIPNGAVDAFHLVHPNAETVIAWLERAGLTVQTVDRPFTGHCFVRASRET